MAGIFKAYDIRGSVPDELDGPTARKIGMAFCRLLNGGHIVIGRDMRNSGRELSDAFSAGYTAEGGAVTDIGMTSTPQVSYAIADGGFDGGVMVTASHLPGNMNGFKISGRDAVPLSGDFGLPALEKVVGSMGGDEHSLRKGRYRKEETAGKYIGHLSGFVRNLRPLTVAVDAGNGMAGPEVTGLGKWVPSWHIHPLYMDPDGNFPHHPANPFLPSTTKDLQKLVVATGSQMGVAFDGDADRCGFIDEQGNRLPADVITALIAGIYLEREPGATIIYDLRSSRIVPETISRLGGRAVRCRVGHAFIRARMLDEDAVFAGELSGHYYFRDTGYCDNGMMAFIQITNLLSRTEIPFSQLAAPLMKYHATGEINMQVSDPPGIMELLEGTYADADIDHLDGMTAEYRTWWFNIRVSNTEPVLRLNLEADSRELVEQKRDEVISKIRERDPGMAVIEG